MEDESVINITQQGEHFTVRHNGEEIRHVRSWNLSDCDRLGGDGPAILTLELECQVQVIVLPYQHQHEDEADEA